MRIEICLTEADLSELYEQKFIKPQNIHNYLACPFIAHNICSRAVPSLDISGLLLKNFVKTCQRLKALPVSRIKKIFSGFLPGGNPRSFS